MLAKLHPKKREIIKSFSFEMLAFFTKTFGNYSQFLAGSKGSLFVRRCCVGLARKIDHVFFEWTIRAYFNFYHVYLLM